MLKVLITGGNGYLGRGIIRRATAEGWDWQITTMSRDESKMIRVKSRWPQVRTIKADCSDDVGYLTSLFSGQDVIIHAGANKLVDVGERSAFEVVRNNVIGSERVAKAAMQAGVRQVIGISSDKAVQPVNTYGMSKALMERIFQEADGLSDTEFVCARYGNVVGSTISIVLYFQDQLKKLGHCLVTNPEMTRFYMGVDEAIDLILYCMDGAKRGSVVIPAMQAMSVADVTCLVLHEPRGTDVRKLSKVKIVGERPGEKLHESLLHRQESVRVLSVSFEEYGFLQLRPPIEAFTNPDPFEITSNDPPGGQMSFERMEALIEDSYFV